MKTWEEFKHELLKDPKTKREYDKLAPRYAVISELIGARIKQNMTQKELAEKIGTKQSAIARLEAGNMNPTVDFLGKIAKALGSKLTIHFT